tara:strand:+ start:3473 stop:3622 length:150 start_codon:yes stop_codon:yes gene_type:complete
MDLDSISRNEPMYDEEFDLEWSENDVVQEPEDDWISSVLGEVEDYVTHQ